MGTDIASGAHQYSSWKAGDPRNGDTQLGEIRDWCGKFVNSQPISYFMIFILLANSALMGIVTFDFVALNPTLEWQLGILDTTMLALFTAELLLNIVYLGPSFLRDGWLVFDLIVIVPSWVFMDSPVTILRSLRVFRIFALISKAQSMKSLINALLRSIPSLASVAVVLILFIYVFCVMFTNLYGDLYDEGYFDWDYFGSLQNSYITLFQLMTTTSWLGVVRQVMVPRPRAWLGFFLFVFITGIIVINLFVAVICEALIDQKTAEAEAQKQTAWPAAKLGVEDLAQEIKESIRAHAKMQKKLNTILSRLPPPS